MSDLGLLTLLAVRLRSRGDAAAVHATVVDLVGTDPGADAVDGELRAALDRGQTRRRGEEGRWSLLPAGEAELNALLAAELIGADRADVTTAYEAFLPLNRRFLAACVGWQDDPVGIDEFHELTAALAPILDALTAVRSRFGQYRMRFAAALDQAISDPRWIDSPTRDSVHTVWFELHEHLLASLGRDRISESR